MAPVEWPREQFLEGYIRVDHGLEQVGELEPGGLDVVKQLYVAKTALRCLHELVEVQRLAVGAASTDEGVQDGAG